MLSGLGLPLTGFPPRTWLALAGLGLISQLVAYYALVYALGHLPATITSVGLLAQIPCTAALAWLLLGEPLTAGADGRRRRGARRDLCGQSVIVARIGSRKAIGVWDR